MENQPKISVILPVYNGGAYLRDAISSILRQQFDDFELLIINDASTDDTEKVILSFSDPRIRYFKNEVNLKLSRTLNKGIDLSNGRYLARMDSDDIALPERFGEQYAFMEANEHIAICGSWFQNFGDKQDIECLETSHEAIVFRLLHQFHMLHPSWMMRKSVLDRHALRYDPNMNAEDYDLVVRLVASGQVANLPKVLMRYRQHGHSLSKDKHEAIIRDSLMIRKHLFLLLGMEVCDNDLDLYTSLAHREYQSDMAFVIRAGQLLSRLVSANAESHFLPDDFIRQRVGYIWFHTCTNTRLPGRWLRKTYAQYGALTDRTLVNISDVIRFLIKMLVR